MFYLQALQHTATHTNTPQHTATHCNTLQHTATCHSPLIAGSTLTHCNTLQHTATHCNTLQHTATHRYMPLATHCYALPSQTTTHRNTPHHTATHCNTPQRTQHAISPSLPYSTFLPCPLVIHSTHCNTLPLSFSSLPPLLFESEFNLSLSPFSPPWPPLPPHPPFSPHLPTSLHPFPLLFFLSRYFYVVSRSNT